MDNDCDIAVVGQLTSDKVVSWKMSAVVRVYIDIHFWLSLEKEQTYEQYDLRTWVRKGEKRSCTIDFKSITGCVDQSKRPVYNGK